MILLNIFHYYVEFLSCIIYYKIVLYIFVKNKMCIDIYTVVVALMIRYAWVYRVMHPWVGVLQKDW